MKVFRLCRKAYRDDLTGRGAELYGGRWNSKGVPILYTAQSRALSVVELAVRLPLGNHPRDYFMLTISIPNTIPVYSLEEDTLPINWKEHPHPHTTQKIGDDFIKRNKELILKVPSVVVEGDFNYLINPKLPDFDKVKIVDSQPFEFDRRLFESRISITR